MQLLPYMYCWYRILIKFIEISQKSEVAVMCNCVFARICTSIRHLNPLNDIFVGESSLSIYMTMTIINDYVGTLTLI